MNQNDIEKLQLNYEIACNDYILAFCKRQGCEVKDVISIGNLYEIADCFFSFSDIKTDVDYKMKKGKIFEWYWNELENSPYPNYLNYAKLNNYWKNKK